MICENIGSFFDFFVKIHKKSRTSGSFCSIHSFHLSPFKSVQLNRGQHVVLPWSRWGFYRVFRSTELTILRKST